MPQVVAISREVTKILKIQKQIKLRCCYATGFPPLPPPGALCCIRWQLLSLQKVVLCDIWRSVVWICMLAVYSNPIVSLKSVVTTILSKEKNIIVVTSSSSTKDLFSSTHFPLGGSSEWFVYFVHHTPRSIPQ